MKRMPSSRLILLVCIALGALPGRICDSNNENKPISNNFLATANGMPKKDNNILSDSLIPSVRNTLTRSRAMLEKLWSKFRTSSTERTNRNLDSSLDPPFYPKSSFYENDDDNEYYPSYLNPTNGPRRRYPLSPGYQTYDQQQPSMPYYEDRFMYPQQFPQYPVSFYRNQFAEPYGQQPYYRRPRRSSYSPPLASSPDAMWYYRNSPVESSYYDAPPRFYRDRPSRTIPSHLNDY